MAEPTQIHALLVEDDTRLAELTRQYLETHGLAVTVEHDGQRGLDLALRHPFDVVLLDWMLPGRSGLEVCQRLQAHRPVPVIMLTARGEEADRVMGLETGADDYLSKPFSPRELLARIRAVLRRSRARSKPGRALTRGDLQLDGNTRTATLEGRVLDLTGYEFSLLYALVDNAGVALSRDRLMELAKGTADEAYDRSVDVHISRLRHKIESEPSKPRRIKTIRGVGYMFVAEAS